MASTRGGRINQNKPDSERQSVYVLTGEDYLLEECIGAPEICISLFLRLQPNTRGLELLSGAGMVNLVHSLKLVWSQSVHRSTFGEGV